MSSKYHIATRTAPPIFYPVSKLSALETEGCLGCLVCVKRESCMYDVYTKRKFDATQIVDSADDTCISCMRCVQECKKNILSRIRNPQFERMGDDYWKPGTLTSIWKQAETGRIPVSGAGYRGPFVGPGFDEMWTDMSEIVRPTRDGIHGREYISTLIELGARPNVLEFSAGGDLLTSSPSFVEIPIPIVFDIPRLPFVGPSAKQAIAEAAVALRTFASASMKDAGLVPAASRKHLILKFDPARDNPADLKTTPIVELAYAGNLSEVIQRIRNVAPEIIVSVRVPLDERAADLASELAAASVGVIHLQADRRGRGFGARIGVFETALVKEIHFRLLKDATRDRVTLLVSGGIALPEHVAKIIACGADGAGVDLALAVAMGCRLCPDCERRTACPVEMDKVPPKWGRQRIANLLASWHAQLIEVLGAMGLREVRRLRGEMGRVMFFDDLEKESFSPLFGDRHRAPDESVRMVLNPKTEAVLDKSRRDEAANGGGPALRSSFPPAAKNVASCPSRYRNRLGRYKAVRTSACTACGKCVQVCGFGVYRKTGVRMLAPLSHLCKGPEVCGELGAYCVDHCPVNALRVGPDPMWRTFGDPRWTSELLVASWHQAETGLPPEGDMEYRIGASGGGFDRMAFAFPEEPPDKSLKPEDVDLGIVLNKRGDERPAVRIGIPFYGGGMSFGSISLPTMLARARAYSAFDSFTCTGEGGFPDELKAYDDHVITQVATGLFGVKEETIQRVRIVEFKYAQGAKPGLGGHLLGDKVTPAVARLREAVVGSSLFSPFPFHSVYSVEDHKKHVDWIKEINPKALVSVKVSGASDVDMVAVGSYYAGAHIIHIDGSYGGTGAAPDIAKKNIAMPIEYAVPKVHRFLVSEGIRDQMTLMVSGGVRTAWDLAKAIALGADGVVIGTAEVVALECIRCGVCESGRGCPRGIATTDTELSLAFDVEWGTQRLINFFHSWAVQLQHILWRLGLRSIRELVGRSDLLIHLDYNGKKPDAGGGH